MNVQTLHDGCSLPFERRGWNANAGAANGQTFWLAYTTSILSDTKEEQTLHLECLDLVLQKVKLAAISVPCKGVLFYGILQHFQAGME